MEASGVALFVSLVGVLEWFKGCMLGIGAWNRLRTDLLT